MNITLDIAALASALMWPAVIIFALAALRNKLPDILDTLARRVEKISLPGGGSIELGKAREMSPTLSGPGLQVDLRQAGSVADITDNVERSLNEQLQDTAPVDYVVANLGEGHEWLTSRLFIMAVLLRRMRSLRVFVFVEDTKAVRRRFVGIADPEHVRWALARRYPWLEEALSKASANLASVTPFDIVSNEGKMAASCDHTTVTPAVELLKEFLSHIQMAVPADNVEWQALPSSIGMSEHAHWLNASMLEEILGGSLDTSYVRLNDLVGRPEQGQLAIILSHPGRYVALTREDRQFDRLLDRHEILEKVARQAVQAG